MEKIHPYISGSSHITMMIEKLRSKFPKIVNSETIKSLGLALNDEKSVINALQFIGIIGDDGKPHSEHNKIFFHSEDEDFQKGFSEIIESAYCKLFDTHGEKAWTLDDPSLVSFFRITDKTSETVGKRQARVFKVFSALSGKIEPPIKRARQKAGNSSKASPPKPKDTPLKTQSNTIIDHLGMSIKIDVNLPSDASKETYDNIFRSIREHLING